VLEDEVTEGKIASARLPVTRDRVSVEIEDILLNLHVGAVGRHNPVARRVAVIEHPFSAIVVAGMLVVVDIVVVYPNSNGLLEVDSADKVGIIGVVAVVHADRGTTPAIDLIMINLHVLAGVHRDAIGILCSHGREWVVTLPAIEPDPTDMHPIASGTIGTNLQ